MEVNPGTAEFHAFPLYRKAGINRLSFGAQSFNDEKLASLGRIHCADETRGAFALARQAGFDNINLDIMYGLPNQSVSEALAAHAWVELDGKALGENTTRYVTLSSDQHVMTGGLPGRRDPQPAAKKATR